MSDKTTSKLQIRKKELETAFSQVSEQIVKFNEERLRLQGEYRLLTKLISEEEKKEENK